MFQHQQLRSHVDSSPHKPSFGYGAAIDIAPRSVTSPAHVLAIGTLPLVPTAVPPVDAEQKALAQGLAEVVPPWLIAGPPVQPPNTATNNRQLKSPPQPTTTKKSGAILFFYAVKMLSSEGPHCWPWTAQPTTLKTLDDLVRSAYLGYLPTRSEERRVGKECMYLCGNG